MRSTSLKTLTLNKMNTNIGSVAIGFSGMYVPSNKISIGEKPKSGEYIRGYEMIFINIFSIQQSQLNMMLKYNIKPMLMIHMGEDVSNIVLDYALSTIEYNSDLPERFQIYANPNNKDLW